jgi:hypothetical protein
VLLDPSLIIQYSYPLIDYRRRSNDMTRVSRHAPFRHAHDGFPTPSTLFTSYTMTTANPSHNPFRESEGRHAQAIHRASGTQFPDDLPARDDDEESIDGDERKVKREARRRVRQVMPPMPDLRFEQVSPISTPLLD